MSNDELVPVMIPKQHLSKVYRLLADLDAGDAAPTTHPGATPRPNEATAEWTPARLRRMVEESPPAMVFVLRELATHPGEYLNAQQLARSIKHKPNATWNTIAGTFGAFGRRLVSRYGLETWPFENVHDHAAGARKFRMDPDTARRVLECLPKQ